jgi:predicted DNA-binding helix-hairpin-helix protein
MIVGADASDDQTILNTAETLYGSYKLKRVYYSAFSPIPQSPDSVPLAPPPLLREHRLYQADFLLRGYGFTAGELMPAPATWRSISTPSWPGRCPTATISRWT